MLKNFWEKMRNNSGLIMTEALVAVASLAGAAIIVGAMFSNTINMTKTSRDYVTAQNYAIFSVEAVKQVRDSNWLLNPSRSECWLQMVPVADADCSLLDSVDANQNYRLVEVSDGEFILDDGPDDELDLEEYGHQENYSMGDGYYVQLRFESFGPFLGDEALRVRVKVQWLDGRQVREVLKSFILGNYN